MCAELGGGGLKRSGYVTASRTEEGLPFSEYTMARPEHILDEEKDLSDVLRSSADTRVVRRDVASRDIVVWDQPV